MSTEEALRMVAQASIVASFAPAIVGLVRIERRTTGQRALWAWMVLGLLLNLLMMSMGTRGKATTSVAQLSHIAFAVVGVIAIAAMTESPRIRRAMYAALTVYLLWWGWRVLNQEYLADFSAFSGPALWMVLSCSAAALIGDRLSRIDNRPLRDPVILTGLAVLVSYAPSAALEPVSISLYGTHRDLTLWLWLGRGILVLVGIITFTLVFLWTIPPRSSPGSS